MKILIPLLLFLCGCTTTETIEVPVVVTSPIICPTTTKAEPIVPLDVIFSSELTIGGIYVLALNGRYYSNLAINSANTLRYIEQQNLIIDNLQNCIENHNKKGSQ